MGVVLGFSLDSRNTSGQWNDSNLTSKMYEMFDSEKREGKKILFQILLPFQMLFFHYYCLYLFYLYIGFFCISSPLLLICIIDLVTRASRSKLRVARSVSGGAGEFKLPGGLHQPFSFFPGTRPPARTVCWCVCVSLYSFYVAWNATPNWLSLAWICVLLEIMDTSVLQ